MLLYIIKRILYIVVVFVILSMIIFGMYNLVPGDPARAEIWAYRETLEPDAFESLYQQTRARMGLDDPIPVRYVKWFTRLVQFDFGMSNYYKREVIDVATPYLMNTIRMNVFVTFFGLLITIPLGIAMAVRRNSLFDRSVQVITLVGVSIPVFIIALLAIYFFAVKLRWLPVSGAATAGFRGTGFEQLMDTLKHLVLPVGVLVIQSLAGVTRYIRSAMGDALSMDYIKTARSKGLSERTVIYSHAWRNALLPVITLLIGWIVGIFYGSIVVESMFNINGLGKLFIDALGQQDWNMALAVQMFYVVLALMSNLIIDLSYGFVDPRVKVHQ